MKAHKTNIALSLDAIPAVPTATQKSDIRNLFDRMGLPRSDADALIVNWTHIREAACQHALRTDLSDSFAQLMSPPVRKRRDRQLRQGAAAADRAVASLRKILETVGHHWELTGRSHGRYLAFEAWVDGVISQIVLTKRGIESYRSSVMVAPAIPARRGTRAWLAETCLLEVLAAYFRRKKWRVSQSQTGLFAETAFILLPERGTGRSSMSPSRLRRLARLRQDFPDLDAIAPSVR